MSAPTEEPTSVADINVPAAVPVAADDNGTPAVPVASSSSSSSSSSSTSSSLVPEPPAKELSSFRFLNAGVGSDGLFVDADSGVTSLSSLCMNCREQGTTRLLLVDIPFFRQIIIMAFECDECGFRSSDVQFGGTYAEKGVRYRLSVQAGSRDLDREIVKSDNATITIPELEFEIPPQTQQGCLNTVEGLLMKAITDLDEGQDDRRIHHPELADQLDVVLARLRKFMDRSESFTFVLDDPAGNSFVESYHSPASDPHLIVDHYERTRAMNIQIGLSVKFDYEGDEEAEEEEVDPSTEAADSNSATSDVPTVTEQAKSEDATPAESESGGIGFNAGEVSSYYKAESVNEFPESCTACGHQGHCRMVICNIPFFKEVVLMAFTCDGCGFRNSEIKSCGELSPKGRKIIFRLTNEDDLTRSVIKSGSAGVEIPELELELGPGTLGSLFTTVEGLLAKIEEQLQNTHIFSFGDSAQGDKRQTFRDFLDRLHDFQSGKTPFTLILDDPLANCHLQNIYAPDPDPNLTVEDYVRSFEQDEELGLHDICTEGYEKKEAEKKEAEKKEAEKKEAEDKEAVTAPAPNASA